MRVMEPTGNPPEQTGNQADEVTRAAVDTVAEASELAGEDTSKEVVLRRRALRRVTARLGMAIAAGARRGANVTGRGVTSGSKWLSGQVLTMAPRLPVRDLATLRGQYPDRTPDQIADALIEGASRASATVGVAVGAWSVLPWVPAIGVEVATETLSVVGVEIKLVAELHEVYGMRAPGSVIDRMTAYVGAWASRRGVALAPGGLVLVAGSPLARQLQRRLAARAGRSVFSLGPLLTGAVAGGLLNRRETRKLGRILRDDLRARSPFAEGWLD
ncbi:MAG TPA: hypothetical protein VMA95_10555 [Streptosporangiaceae bacterium]|nr:hypothetical protein [Streptosporangiaceae bacterium]